jgi:photosystem II stability/assembly factor-like uncharacterized protein
MKKLVLALVLTVSLMAFFFVGCVVAPAPPPPATRAAAGGQYDYGISRPAEMMTSALAPLYYNILVGGNGSIVRSVTNDNNISYQQMASGTLQNLNDVRISNNPYQDDIAVVGDSGTVLISDNSGLDWTKKAPVTNANLYGVDHSYSLYAVGESGTILFANEIMTGNLVARPSGTTRNLRSVVISNLNTQRVIVVGEKGTILRTTDTGVTWEDVSIPDTTFDFYDISQKGIYYNTGDIFVAVGSQGRIYKSTDIGATWEQKTSGTSNTLRSVYFHTLDSGAVVGDNGTILLTTNGGESWYIEPSFESPSTRHFTAIAVTNINHGTFVALSDTMFYVSIDPLTITGVENAWPGVPSNYSLGQNYPNPFNPTTTITFAIPSKSFVSLKAFDTLGREVATLRSEELPAGAYQHQWNAEGLTSGIYFYRLQTESFMETKKLVLLR